MSGAIDYVSLFAGDATGSGASIVSLAASLVPGSGAAAGTAAGGNALTALQLAEQDQTQDIATEAKQPQVQRVIASFTKAVQSATSPQQLLQNPDVLTVLLTANGLGDQTGYTALAQKALLSDPSDSSSLVSQLGQTNSAWTATASLFQFAAKGLSVIQNPQVMATLAQGYAEVLWRQSLDQATPGLSNALDFRSRASSITSVDQILGDATFRTVVTTALGIPPQIAYQDLGAQEQAIASRVDIADFKQPSFVNAMTDRYLLAEQSSSSSSSSSLDALAVQAQGLMV